MAVARTIYCYVNNNIIQRVVSSDNRLIAGYCGEHNATKITFVFSGELWTDLIKYVDISSPSGAALSPIYVDNSNSFLLPIQALDTDGKLKFTLSGSEINPDTQEVVLRIKTGVSVLPVLEALDDGDIDPTAEIQGYLETVLNTINIASSTNDEITAAENLRVIAENLRISGEFARIDAEAARIIVEAARVLAENDRTNAESARDLAESARILAEQSRVSAESVRIDAENLRIINEEERISSEAVRVEMELDRLSAEETRIDNEGSRVVAEQGRVTAESGRVIAEQSRVNLYENISTVNGILFSDGAGNVRSAEFIHTQSIATSVWTINHNRDTYPSVTIIDSANNIVIGNVCYTNSNQLTVTFNGDFTGKAYII